MDIPSIRGMSLEIRDPNASAGATASFTSIILVPEPSRALLLAMSAGLLVMRRRR